MSPGAGGLGHLNPTVTSEVQGHDVGERSRGRRHGRIPRSTGSTSANVNRSPAVFVIQWIYHRLGDVPVVAVTSHTAASRTTPSGVANGARASWTAATARAAAPGSAPPRALRPIDPARRNSTAVSR